MKPAIRVQTFCSQSEGLAMRDKVNPHTSGKSQAAPKDSQ